MKRLTAPLPLRSVVLLVVVPFGFGYTLSYLFRAVNAVVAPDLVIAFDLSAEMLGLMTAAYLLAFAAFQIPLGLLLDRFGPRRVQACLLGVAALGALVFAVAESAAALVAGRALIGLGFSGGLMATFKAMVVWARPERLPLLNGMAMAFGGLGIVVATEPSDLASQAFGYQAVFLFLAGVTVLAAIGILVFAPREAPGGASEGLGSQVRAIGRIFADPVFLRLAPLVATTSGGHVAIQTLWAGPYLADVSGLDRGEVAGILFGAAAAFAAGVFAAGLLVEVARRQGRTERDVMVGGLVLFLLSEAMIVAFPDHGLIRTVSWIAFGFAGQFGILAYAYLSRYFGVAYAGRSNTAMNLIVFGTAFTLQYAIGVVIGLWPEGVAGSHPPVAHRTALATVVVLQVLAFLWYVAAPRARSSPLVSELRS